MAPIDDSQEVEEDDYLTMTFEDSSASKKHETLTQKKKRLMREAETRSRTKSKAELAAEERSKREAALNNPSIDTTSKGYKMMAALGYKPGTALGVSRSINEDTEGDTRLLEPVGLEMKEDRSGIGADAEKKRKFREEVEAREMGEKRKKVEEGEFRQRQHQEREEKRMEGQIWGAMKICEKLDEEDNTAVKDQELDDGHGSSPLKSKPLNSINVLWRGLVKQRALDEREKRMKYDLYQSLSKRPTYDDPDEDLEDRVAFGKKQTEETSVDLDEDDQELDEFTALNVADKLDRLTDYLRERWNYCFWCKFRYPDKAMDGCPGLTEDEHG